MNTKKRNVFLCVCSGPFFGPFISQHLHGILNCSFYISVFGSVLYAAQP